MSKKCNKSEHGGVVRDIGRTQIGVQKTRGMTDGDH